MLRRQVKNEEYIALTEIELKKLTGNSFNLDDISFIVPLIKMQRGYYATEMHPISLPKIKEIVSSPTSFSINFTSKPSVDIRNTSQFIRWLGL